MSSGYKYGDPEPRENCPYCNTECHADFVDIGVGMQQVGPYHCNACGATQIGPNDRARQLTDLETETGWYGPDSELPDTANVIDGKLVSAETMKRVYDAKWRNNPEYNVPGAVAKWREELRKPKGN